ncbi:MAG TPA: arginine N-succinyltransferase [Desulfobulbaceae bacterium]|nr:arginine N-succinyltransferase [Desulfobulbaceae bacterium]
MDNIPNSGEIESKKGFSGAQVAGIVAAVMVLTAMATLVAAWMFLHPRPFTPVTLTHDERQQLEDKLERVEAVTGVEAPSVSGDTAAPDEYTADGKLRPEAYSEEGVNRQVSFTEREVNALIATNTELADKFAVDLARNLVSVKMLVPLEPDFPFFGGKTLRVRAGVEVAYRAGKPIIRLKGVSLMGVPLPNAWLGGMKNIDLVQEFSAEQGFWKAFAEGVESIDVAEGTINIVMKE